MEIPYRGSGIIFYNNKEYKCDLYFSENKGKVILKVYSRSEHDIGSFLELPLEIDEVSGKVESGYEFTLLNLKRGGMIDNVSSGVTEYTYYAEFLLSGIGNHSLERQTFSKVNFVLSNIMEWGELSLYYLGKDQELKLKDKPPYNTIYSGVDYTIVYKVNGSFLPFVERHLFKESIILKQHGTIEISFSTEHIFEDYLAIVVKLKRLLEIALLRTVNIEKVYAFSNKIKDAYGDELVERRIDIYGEIIRAVDNDETSETLQRFQWITLSELIAHNSFAEYVKKQEKLAPIIELYVELFHLTDSSITRVFLNIVQALETYHSRFITNNITFFKERVKALVQNLPPDSAKSVEESLMAKSKKHINLESRLADLLYASGEIYFDTGDISHKDFPSVIARTRNYYIHYDERLKNKYRILSLDELDLYKTVLLQMLEYYILLELGFSIHDASNKIKNRWGNVSREIQILKESRNKDRKIEND